MKIKDVVLKGFLMAVLLLIVMMTASCSTKTRGFSSEDIIYFIMTDRFYDGDVSNNNYEDVDINNSTAYHGGDLQGIIQKLDYIEDLGVTAIWITPIVDNQQYGYHGYWATDFTKVDEHLGTLDDMKELVAECHKRDIKVVLDYVINHTGYESDLYESEPDWFNPKSTILNWNDQDQVEKGWLSGLPDFNFENTDVREFFIDNALWWIEQTGIDGMRLDTVKHVPIDYWEEFSSAIKAEYPDFFFIGEVWHSSTNYIAKYQEAGLDSMVNYPLFDAIRMAFSGKNAYNITFAVRNEDKYIDSTLNTIFIDNHDNTRFMTYAFIDSELQTKQALTFIMSYPAIPIIYYGTEIAMKGGTDPDNRRDMEWDTVENNEMHSFYLQLNEVRSDIFKKGLSEFEIIYNDRESIVYKRFDEDEQITFIINVVDEAQEQSIEIYDKNMTLIDYFTKEEFTTNDDGVLNITLEPLRIYVLYEK